MQAVVAGAVYALAGCRGVPEKPTPSPAAPLPQMSGTVAVDGLTARVRVARDRWGIPHITAETQDDLFFAQGFVQAQDRLFQMDLWRRSVQGRLSEVLGANFIERDAMTRRMQYRGNPDADWASYGPDVKAIAAAFTAGINAWIAQAADRLPEAFTLAGWRPEPWRPEDLLNRTDAFLASANARDEILRAQLVHALGPALVDSLFPSSSGTRTIIPRGLDVAAVSPMVADLPLRVGSRPFFSGFAAPFRVRLKADITGEAVADSTAEAVVSGFSRTAGTGSVRLQPDPSSGSNAWAVAGSRSATGAPLLAVDPHRPLDNPSLRYLIHLKAPGWNVAGAAAPWLPGVIIGHNDAMAWGMTSLAADTQDFFVEKINPANSRQVREGTRWVDMVVRKDAIPVKRREPFEYEQLYTKRGVVVALDSDRQLAYTLRWSGAAAGGAGELAALQLSRARSWTEFQDALTRWRMPPAVFVYADRDGHIAMQQAVAAPTRRGWDGKLPAPGWTGEFEWTSWAANSRARSTVDPPSGFVISANESEPRLRRIHDVLNADSQVTVAALQRLQHDTYAWNADRLVPLLAGVSVDHAEVEDARQRLLRWNRQVTANAADAALYVAWERALTRELLGLKVPSAIVAELGATQSAALVPAIVTPSRAWFGDDSVKARDNLLVAALTIAVDEIKAAAPRQITFMHPLALTDPARRRFNVGPFAIGGYAETVRAMSSSTRPGSPAIGASFLAIFDLADWDRSVVINAPGQSEWPQSLHFSDLAPLWASEEYVPLAFSDEAVAANLETTLTLIPKRP